MKLSIAATILGAVIPSTSSFTVNSPFPFGVTTTQNTKSTVNKNKQLFGILDEVNSDAFNLLGNNDDDDGAISSEMEQAYETFLANLVFSTNDPRMDIVDNYDLVTDEEWMTWLTNKIETSNDVEEKMALRDLKDMIVDVQKRMELSKMAEERAKKEAEEAEEKRIADAEAAAAEGRTMSDADVLRKAGAVDRGGMGESAAAADGKQKKISNFMEEELTPEIRMSYEDMCKKVLPPYKAGDTPASIVYSYYDQFDAQFIKVLKERSTNGDTDSQTVLDALSVEQSKRMAAATENIKNVISLGDPMRMEGAIVKLAREGKIDEPFLLLLEANANQALAAGANGPAQLMKRLGKRAMEEKDKQSSSKEVKLLRQLLRTDESSEREKLLEDAFTPKDALLVPGTAANAAKAMEGEVPDEEKPMPEVPPPDFINACKAVLLNFGNLSTDDDRGDLATRIKQIASEAEVVATRIYGKSMTTREQQDRMWKDQTTSIFDLETLEIEAERMGEAAPWTNPDNDDILPGFDADGKMKIGGS